MTVIPNPTDMNESNATPTSWITLLILVSESYPVTKSTGFTIS